MLTTPTTIPPLYRSRDTWIVMFLITYALTIICIDNIALYPPSLVPGPFMTLHQHYLSTYNDQLAISRPHWFHFFALGEALYQFPITIWSLWALWTRNPKGPAHLLVWSVVTAGTTFTCMYEFWQNDFGGKMSWEQRKSLIQMFGLYAGIFTLIGVDMFCRIQKMLCAAAKVAKVASVRRKE